MREFLLDRPAQPRAVGTLGKRRIGGREVAAAAYHAGFRDKALYEAVMVCGSESWCFSTAHNDNINDKTGKVTSRDVGLWQINISADKIGTPAEEALYDPKTNARAAFALWKRRGWQPWVGHNTGAYLHDTYVHWALLGVANFYLTLILDDVEKAGQTSGISVPWLSIKQLQRFYPKTKLG